MLAITRNAIAGTSSTAASLVRTFQFRGDRLPRDPALDGSGGERGAGRYVVRRRLRRSLQRHRADAAGVTLRLAADPPWRVRGGRVLRG